MELQSVINGFSRPSGIGGFTTDPKPDLDFWYKPTIENFENLIRALNELQVDVMDLKKIVIETLTNQISTNYSDSEVKSVGEKECNEMSSKVYSISIWDREFEPITINSTGQQFD